MRSTVKRSGLKKELVEKSRYFMNMPFRENFNRFKFLRWDLFSLFAFVFIFVGVFSDFLNLWLSLEVMSFVSNSISKLLFFRSFFLSFWKAFWDVPDLLIACQVAPWGPFDAKKAWKPLDFMKTTNTSIGNRPKSIPSNCLPLTAYTSSFEEIWVCML